MSATQPLPDSTLRVRLVYNLAAFALLFGGGAILLTPDNTSLGVFCLASGALAPLIELLVAAVTYNPFQRFSSSCSSPR